MWTCDKAFYIVAADVDGNGVPKYHKISSKTPSPYIVQLGVHPSTGRVFVMRHTADRVREVFDVTTGAIDDSKPVLTVTAPPGSWDYAMAQLVFLEKQVCVFRSKDERRGHPQGDDLACATLPEFGASYGGADFSCPGLSPGETYLPYVDHSIPVPCTKEQRH
jgi:hypothetical protein